MQILSPAKINLFLQITGKRADGYHELVSLMCCVSLYDKLDLQFGAGRIQIECQDPLVPRDETNLAHRAATVFFDALKKREGVKIFIEKHIPVAAGLGGGSSNAGAVLLGLNRHYGQPFSDQQLAGLGVGIGADVPFFLLQRPALATGIGQKLEIFKGLIPYKILLVYPGFPVSTVHVYRKLNLRLTKCEKKFKRYPFNKSKFDAALHLCNDLETVALQEYPAIVPVKQQVLEQGAAGVLMSGSGPTVFGLFADADRALGAKKALAAVDNWQTFLVDMLLDTD